MDITDYLPIVIFSLIAAVVATAPIILGLLCGDKKHNNAKLEPYECGFDAQGDARVPFDIRFYLVAILFILFDLETAFFFPWALALRDIGWFGWVSMMVFLGFLLIGFAFEWYKGALEWE